MTIQECIQRKDTRIKRDGKFEKLLIQKIYPEELLISKRILERI
jgi:hypothetical protein